MGIPAYLRNEMSTKSTKSSWKTPNYSTLTPKKVSDSMLTPKKVDAHLRRF
jgi:hypothetical protein